MSLAGRIGVGKKLPLGIAFASLMAGASCGGKEVPGTSQQAGDSGGPSRGGEGGTATGGASGSGGSAAAGSGAVGGTPGVGQGGRGGMLGSGALGGAGVGGFAGVSGAGYAGVAGTGGYSGSYFSQGCYGPDDTTACMPASATPGPQDCMPATAGAGGVAGVSGTLPEAGTAGEGGEAGSPALDCPMCGPYMSFYTQVGGPTSSGDMCCYSYHCFIR